MPALTSQLPKVKYDALYASNAGKKMIVFDFHTRATLTFDQANKKKSATYTLKHLMGRTENPRVGLIGQLRTRQKAKNGGIFY